MRNENNFDRAPENLSDLLPSSPALFVIISAALLACSLVWWTTASGITVTPDSVIYLSAADSLLSGNGLTPITYHYAPSAPAGQTLVAFPPGYPLLLLSSHLLVGNTLTGARYLDALIAAANVLLVAAIVYAGSRRSILATGTALLLVLTCVPLLEVHTMAWSEPPFFFFILVSLFLLVLYQITAWRWLLFGIGIAAGLAAITRYAGITLLPPLMLSMLFARKDPMRKRVSESLIVLVTALLPLGICLLRNRLLAHVTTNRTFKLQLTNIRPSCYAVVDLLFGFFVRFPAGYLRVPFVLLGGAIVVIAMVASIKNSGITSRVMLFAASFVPIYLLFLVGYNAVAYPHVDLAIRTVSPVYLPSVILLICVVGRFRNNSLRKTLLVALFVFAVVNLKPLVSFAVARHNDNPGFTSNAWKNSPTLAYVKTLPPTATVYSNGIDAIYVLTGVRAQRIPAKFDPTRGKNNSSFTQEVEALKRELIEKHATAVYFDEVTWRSYLPTRDELENTYHLPVAARFSDGVVFGGE